MNFKLISILAVLPIAACASLDGQATSFEPLKGDSFRYQAFADVAYKIDSPSAEKQRLAWLEGYLESNDLCRDGYEITEKKTILKSKGALADIYDIIYYGNCT